MNGINSRDLDNYITGHYGEDQFRECADDDSILCPHISAHEQFAMRGLDGDVYDYDTAEDGPECETITRILAHHPLYSPGQELGHLKFLSLVNRIAREAYGRRYGRLGPRQQARVRVMVAAVRGGIHHEAPC